MTQSNVIVVDTNIWLDYLLKDRPGSLDAARLFALAKTTDVPLVIPSHAMSDVFFIMKQEFKKAHLKRGRQASESIGISARVAAWAIIDLIMELATVGPSDQMDAIMASKNRTVHGDYEDNLVVACAVRTSARLLVTNDEQLIRHSPVATMSASDALALLETEA